jgi:choline/glycine/proline betaine transport protein
LHEVTAPALDEVCEDLCARGLKAALETSTVEAFGIDTAGLRLELDGQRTFKHQIYPAQRDLTDWRGWREALTDREVFARGQPWLQPHGYGKDEVTADMPDHYEVHLEFLHQQRDAPPCSTVVENVPPKADWETTTRPSTSPSPYY